MNGLIFQRVDNYANQYERGKCLSKSGTKNPKKNVIYKKSRAKVKSPFTLLIANLLSGLPEWIFLAQIFIAGC
jgi:hypothetical protein